MKNTNRTARRGRRALLAIALALVMLTGCSGTDVGNEAGALPPNPQSEDDTRTWQEMLEETGEWTEEVLELFQEQYFEEFKEKNRPRAAFVDSEQTGDLVIWIPPFSGWMDTVIDAYKEMYPNVNVITEEFGFEEFGWDGYATQLSTALMAGRGSDVIFPCRMFGAVNIYKMADAGAFMDLNELVEQDEDFNLDDYIKPVLDSGIYRGKRYIMPYSYLVNIYISVPEKLNIFGFDTSQMGDTASFLNEAARALPKMQANPNFRYMFSSGIFSFEYFWNNSGIQIADYENGEIFPEEDELRKLFEAYKPFYRSDNIDPINNYIWEHRAPALLNDMTLFYHVFSMQEFLSVTRELKKEKSPFRFDVMPGMDGKIYATTFNSTAIRSGSPNKQNAWNFIKLMLSPEVQENSNATSTIPVHKDSILRYAEDAYNFLDEHFYAPLSQDEMEAYIELITNVDDSVLTYRTSQIYTAIHENMAPFFKDEVSCETAIEKLRNFLRIYISE
jgi:ABC-type glycerol-3-phosphate transport system substrate-binding protein